MWRLSFRSKESVASGFLGQILEHLEQQRFVLRFYGSQEHLSAVAELVIVFISCGVWAYNQVLVRFGSREHAFFVYHYAGVQGVCFSLVYE